MSWGKGITLALGAFIALIISLVYMSSRQHFSLVTENYYEEALEYDKVQARKSNYSRLGEEAVIEIGRDGVISLELPASFRDARAAGTVHFYSPVDARRDVIFDLDQPFRIPAAQFKKGKWNVIVQWEHGGKEYQFERAVFIH